MFESNRWDAVSHRLVCGWCADADDVTGGEKKNKARDRVKFPSSMIGRNAISRAAGRLQFSVCLLKHLDDLERGCTGRWSHVLMCTSV